MLFISTIYLFLITKLTKGNQSQSQISYYVNGSNQGFTIFTMSQDFDSQSKADRLPTMPS